MEHFDKARRQDPDGRRAPLDGDERGGEEAHRLPRGRPRDRRPPSVPEHDPVYKVTIIPRGRALGVTHVPARRRQVQLDNKQPRSTAAVFAVWRPRRRGIDLRHRQGHHRRLQRHRARDQRWRATWSPSGGLSDEIGPDLLRRGRGRSVPRSFRVAAARACPNDTARKIDEVVRGILDQRVRTAPPKILKANIDKAAHHGRGACWQYETIDASQIDDDHGRTVKPGSAGSTGPRVARHGIRRTSASGPSATGTLGGPARAGLSRHPFAGIRSQIDGFGRPFETWPPNSRSQTGARPCSRRFCKGSARTGSGALR